MFENNLAEALPVAEVRREQDIGEDVEQFTGLADHAFSADEKAGNTVLLTFACGKERRADDAAGGFSNTLRQGHVVFLCRAHFQQDTGQHRCIGNILLIQPVQVETEVKVKNAVGEKRMLKHINPVDLSGFALDDAHLCVEVAALQQRDRGQGLLGVGRGLQLQQPLRVVRNLPEFLR